MITYPNNELSMGCNAQCVLLLSSLQVIFWYQTFWWQTQEFKRFTKTLVFCREMSQLVLQNKNIKFIYNIFITTVIHLSIMSSKLELTRKCISSFAFNLNDTLPKSINKKKIHLSCRISFNYFNLVLWFGLLSKLLP